MSPCDVRLNTNLFVFVIVDETHNKVSMLEITHKNMEYMGYSQNETNTRQALFYFSWLIKYPLSISCEIIQVATLRDAVFD